MHGSGGFEQRHRRARLIVLASVAILSVAPVDSSQPAGRQTAQANFWACSPDRGPVFASAECGAIRVFENRRTRQGRTIDIAFARWRSGPRASSAVFLLAGGPGGSSASVAGAAEGWARPLRSTMDVVAVDQRGTWHSNALHCAQEVEARPATSFGHIFDESWVRQCRGLLERTADLAQYTTDAAADDLDDVRAALGYGQISVYGASYGTRLAQAYMRRYPKRVRAVVLDAAIPFDSKLPLTYAASAQQALDRVFDQCAVNPACRRAHPNLRADFARLLDRFRAGPIATSVTTSGGVSVLVNMSLGDFGYAVRGILYVSNLIDDLPDWIGRAATTGDVSVFAQRYWERQRAFSRTFATGLHFSVLCSEDVAFIGDQEIAGATSATFLGRYVIDEYRRACALWPTAELSPDFRQPIAVSVPTLLVSGAFDPVTPPAFAEQIARTLPASRLVVARQGAHGSVASCPLDAALFVLQSGSTTGAPDVCR